jgi:hypothetical protein
VDDALIPKVESLLLDQWQYEIDREVKIRLVGAIGEVVGWGDVSPATIERAIAILQEATGEFNTRTDIASAIGQIATNAIRRPDISREERYAIVELCVKLAVDLTIALQESDGANETNRFGEAYNKQREYILALYTIACTDMDHLPYEAEQIIQRVTDGLFEIADGEVLHKANPDVANDVRFLALYYLNRIADEDSTNGMSARSAMKQHAISRYKPMIGDPQDEIARNVVTNLVSLMGDEDGATFFVDIVLNDGDPLVAAIKHRRRWVPTAEDDDILRTQIRKRAAQAIASIPDNGKVHDELVDALKEGNLAGSRARDALIFMGGQKSVESIVEHSLQRQVEERYFKPMEEASKRGWELLGDVRNWSGSNYKYALNVAITTLVVGVILLALGVLNLLSAGGEDTPSAIDWGLLVGGGLFTVLGFFGGYLWEPVKGLNKVAAELSQLIMSFENYLGRMRLIGLGFAHAYTNQNWGQLSFLGQISDLSAEAMRESIVSLEDIGSWPEFDTDKVITVPLVVDQSVEDARNLLKQAKLEIEIGAAIYAADKDEGRVVTQEPPEGTFVARNTKVKVVPSTKQRPLVEVPDFRKKTVVEVTKMAQESGLTISGYRLTFDGSEEEAHVLEQDLKVGLSVGKDSALVLTIGKNGAGPA